MKLHGNARTCPNSRALIARRVMHQDWSLAQAAEAAGVSEPTARKWVRRARAGESLEDRSSRPRRSPARLAPRLVRAIEAFRRLWMTAAEIAEILGLALSTVSLWLRRVGLGKRSRLTPPEPPNRYERRHPGELVHVDIKKLGRISDLGAGHRVIASRRSQGDHRRRRTGWEFVHVMVDDHSRLAYVEVHEHERGPNAVAFPRRAMAWFGARGVRVRRLLSDNGACFRSHLFAACCRELGLRHSFTRPYRPRTNGKAERFIRTLINEWAWVQLYGSNEERRRALGPWLIHYNYRRPHSALGHQPP
jgi:transposase InsO family protein